MKFKTKVGHAAHLRTACLILPVFTGKRHSETLMELDIAASGQLTQAMKREYMSGEIGQTLLLRDVPALACERILLVGCGKQREFDLAGHRKAFGAALDELSRSRITEAVTTLHQPAPKQADLYRTVRDDLLTADVSQYRFDELKSEAKPPKRPLRTLAFWAAEATARIEVERAIAHGRAMSRGVELAKNLANLPGNICTPSYLADQAHDMAKLSKRLKVSVLEEKDMETLGMGALLAVSRGSRQSAKLIVMEYRGADKKTSP